MRNYIDTVQLTPHSGVANTIKGTPIVLVLVIHALAQHSHQVLCAMSLAVVKRAHPLRKRRKPHLPQEARELDKKGSDAVVVRSRREAVRVAANVLHERLPLLLEGFHITRNRSK